MVTIWFLLKTLCLDVSSLYIAFIVECVGLCAAPGSYCRVCVAPVITDYRHLASDPRPGNESIHGEVVHNSPSIDSLLSSVWRNIDTPGRKSFKGKQGINPWKSCSQFFFYWFFFIAQCSENTRYWHAWEKSIPRKRQNTNCKLWWFENNFSPIPTQAVSSW